MHAASAKLSVGPDRRVKAYPYLEAADFDQCLAYAAWRMEERDLPLFRPAR